jgi:hypothetical protein
MVESAALAAVPFSSAAAQVLRISPLHPLNMGDDEADVTSGSSVRTQRAVIDP